MLATHGGQRPQAVPPTDRGCSTSCDEYSSVRAVLVHPFPCLVCAVVLALSLRPPVCSHPFCVMFFLCSQFLPHKVGPRCPQSGHQGAQLGLELRSKRTLVADRTTASPPLTTTHSSAAPHSSFPPDGRTVRTVTVRTTVVDWRRCKVFEQQRRKAEP